MFLIYLIVTRSKSRMCLLKEKKLSCAYKVAIIENSACEQGKWRAYIFGVCCV